MDAEVILAFMVFLAVGAIVSLDVAGLTLSKVGTFAREGRSVQLWAFTNACWHAGLLFVYILVISGIFTFSFAFFEVLEDLLLAIVAQLAFIKVDLGDYVRSVFGLIEEHAKLILGLISLYIVWRTYSEKIVGEPTLGRTEDLPTLAKTVYDILEICIRSLPLPGAKRFNARVFLRWQAQAALVAVDMLALAALMKAMGYLESLGRQITLVGLVFAIVFALTLFIGIWGRRKYAELQETLGHAQNRQADSGGQADEDAIHAKCTWDWIIVSLRLIEPWLIFYFVLELMSFLIFEERIHSVGFLFGSTLLLFGLVNRHTLLEIVRSCLPLDADAPAGAGEGPLRGFKEFREDFGKLGLLILKTLVYVVLAVLLVLVLVATFYASPADFISLDTEISRLFGYLTFLTIGLFLVSDRIERKVYHFIDGVMESRHTFLFILSALILAGLVPIYEELSGAAFSRDGLIDGSGVCSVEAMGMKVNHIHAMQIVIWLAYLSLVGVLLEISDRKHRIVEGQRLKEESREFSRQFVVIILGASGCIFFVIGHAQEYLRELFLPCFPAAEALALGLLS